MRGISLATLLVIIATGGCKKASEEDCRKAIENVLTLRGAGGGERSAELEAEVRKCRATAKPEEVACLIAAKTAAELDACEAKR